MIFTQVLFTQALFAQDAEEKKEKQEEFSRELIMQVSIFPDTKAKLSFTKYFTFMFLQGESPLTEDNNIKLSLTAEVTPVSFGGLVGAIWTPIAFFQLNAGGGIGSGWILRISEDEYYGIGINQADEDGHSKNNGRSFDAIHWNIYAGGVLQFDLAALFPGEWNHIIGKTTHSFFYRGYARAKSDEAWYVENDEGENTNGLSYIGDFLLGYRMPIFLSMAALMVEANLYLDDIPNHGKWGGDKPQWIFSGILNFTIHKQFEILLAVQFQTARNYLEHDWSELYYRNRTINNSRPYNFEFYRLATILTYRF